MVGDNHWQITGLDESLHDWRVNLLQLTEEKLIEVTVILAGLALLMAAIADITTTAVGLQVGLHEKNPALYLGKSTPIVTVMIALKVGAIVASILGTLIVKQRTDRLWVAVPLAPALIWAAAALWNSLLIFGTVY